MNKELVLKILESGVEIPHFILLQLIATDNELDELWYNVKLRSYREALIRKGFIVEVKNQYFLTEKGVQVYNTCLGEKKEVDIQLVSNEFEKLSKDILEECNKKIKDSGVLQINKQRVYKLNGYNFLPSQKELEERLKSFCEKFHNCDFHKIKEAIFVYTDEVLSNKVSYPRLLKYFIFKDDKNKGIISEMLSYIDNIQEVKEEVADTRKLF